MAKMAEREREGETRSLTKSDLTSRSVLILDNEGKYTRIRALSA